jgi:hypothetical protein
MSKIVGKNLVLILFLTLNCLGFKSFSQGTAGSAQPDRNMNVAEVVIVWDSIQPPPEAAEELMLKILRAVNIYPNSNVSTFDIDASSSNAYRLREVGRISWDIEFISGNSVKLILKVRIKDPEQQIVLSKGMLKSGKQSDFPILYQDDKSLIKINLAGNLTPTLITNTWWGNGKTFTEFNPYGNDPPDTSAALDVEGYVFAGLSGIIRVKKGKVPLYAYAVVNTLSTATFGAELYNSHSNTFNFQIEEAYGGIVGTRLFDDGHLLRFNISFGKQPYRIGTGMLLCQIAGNGGTWGGMNAWPRFSGEWVGLVKVGYDNWKVEGFYVDPHEYWNNDSKTKMAGFNVEYNRTRMLSGGFTYLNVLKSEFPYFYPDYSQGSREGLNAMNFRLQWMPRSNESFLFAKAEGGYQINNKTPMEAYGLSFEGGWSFGNTNWRPAVSYRYSKLTGDDPATKTIERWDILYSGDDVFTWVQGLLMKNILFNTNMEVNKFQIQLFPKGWRITSQYIFFMANQLNTVPSPPIGTFASEQIAQELLLVAERYVSRNIYLRFVFSSLWPGEGISDVLPDPVKKPWMEYQAIFRFSF